MGDITKKDFWECFFQLHQDEIENEYLKSDEEYLRLESELQVCRTEFEELLRGCDNEVWKKYDAVSTAYNDLEAHLIRMMYIKGMEDRDDMEK